MESKNFKKMLAAFGDIEEQFSVTQEELKEIICEAISKAYKKEAGIDDMDVYAVFNDKSYEAIFLNAATEFTILFNVIFIIIISLNLIMRVLLSCR